LRSTTRRVISVRPLAPELIVALTSCDQTRDAMWALVEQVHANAALTGTVANALRHGNRRSCTVVALLHKRYEWPVWAYVILAVDSRAGLQAAHPPSSLAIGWCFGRTVDALGQTRQRRLALAVAITAILCATTSVGVQSAAFVRMSQTDVREGQWIAPHARRDSRILTLSPRSLAEPGLDQTFEWLPVFSGRGSPITYKASNGSTKASNGSTVRRLISRGHVLRLSKSLHTKRQPACRKLRPRPRKRQPSDVSVHSGAWRRLRYGRARFPRRRG